MARGRAGNGRPQRRGGRPTAVRVGKAALITVALLITLAGSAVLVLTNTPWGREQVREFVLGQVRESVEGNLEVGRIEGNLLLSPRLRDVSIEDTEGRPFVEADVLSFRYSIPSLLRQRILLTDIELANARIVLDDPPGEDWNFIRIFPPTPDPDPGPGWGDRIELRNVRATNTRITLRMEWDPGEGLPPEKREEKLRRALAGEARENVVQVPGGYQSVMDFRELHGHFPRIVVAHPDTPDVSVEVAELGVVARPFLTPALEIRGLSGAFRFGDAIQIQDLTVALPGSHLRAEGSFETGTGEGHVELEATPLALADLRFLHPPLPDAAEGRGRATIRMTEGLTHIVAEELDVRMEEGWLEGHLDVMFGDTFRVGESRLAFAELHTGRLEALVPELELPARGELSGSVQATPEAGEFAGTRPAAPEGEPPPEEAVRLDAWLEFVSEAGTTSRLLGRGRLGLAADPWDVRLGELSVRLDPLQSELVRAVAPDLPLRGMIEASATLDGPVGGPLGFEGALAHRDPVAGVSRVRARGGLDLREGLRLVGVEAFVEPLRLALLRDHLEHVPAESTLNGSVLLDGAPARDLHVESDLALYDPGSGISRILTRGGIAVADDVELRSFEVVLAPLQVPSLRAVAPGLPIGGTLDGTALLDGSPAAVLAFHIDLLQQEAGERSRVEGAGEVVATGEGRVSADLELHEVSLVTVGRFVPDAELEGTMAGRVHLEGALDDLLVRGTLELPDAGLLETEGTFNLAREEPRYDLRLELENVNLAALSGRIPESTSIRGTAGAIGRGADPASMQASLLADLSDDAPTRPRRFHAAAAVDAGLARIDSLGLRTRTSEVEVRGSFGLTGAREGELVYRVALDSLHVLTPYLPVEPGVVEPRPSARSAALERWEEELLHIAREAEVEFLATGQEPTLPEAVDTLGIVGARTDVLAGSVEASGWVRGNVERFDLEGTASARELLYGGHHLRSATLAYAAGGVGGDTTTAAAEATAHSLRVAGFAYDSLSVRAGYRGSDQRHEVTGSVIVAQDEETGFLAEGAFELAGGQYELRLEELSLHFEDAAYRSLQPARASWGEGNLTIEDLEVESELGARVRVDGRLPRQEDGELTVLIEDMEIGHLLALLQEREGIQGRLRLDAPIRGTTARPRFDARATLTGVTVNGDRVPDVSTQFAYEDQELTAEGRVMDGGETMLTLEAALPLDLGLEGVTESRLRPGPIRVEARLLDFSLESLPAFTDQLEEVRGTMTGHLSVGGSFEAPELNGALDLVVPSVYVVPLGVRVTEVAGAVRLTDHLLTVDSLVAQSRGPVRITGELDLGRPTEPAFDLAVEARNTRVMNTRDIQLWVDADLMLSGPFEAVEAAGEIRTRRGVIRIPETRELAEAGPLDLEDPETFERVDRILVAARDALIDPSPLFENLRVAVEVRIDRNLWLRSRQANVEIFTPPAIGPLTIRMHGVRPRDMTLDGTVHTERGEYEFMGRRFGISRGSVTFTGGSELDPLIRLIAEHEVQLPGREAFDIRIVLDGTLLGLDTELESTAQPPLSQTDLLSLVVFGRESGSLLQQHGSALSGQGATGGPLVGNVAARATQQFATVGFQALVDELEAETARALGLDVLHIQPTDAPSEIFTGRAGDVLRGTEVEAGRYVTPRLFVSGQARPSFVHPGARVEYQTDGGYLWRTTWRPRFLPAAPTLAQDVPDRASVFGTFLFREWRF